MKCSHCQTDSVEGAAFCMKCGTPLKAAGTRECSWCQRKIPTAAEFCPYCSGDQRTIVLSHQTSEALRLNFEASGFRTKPLDAYELSLLPPLDIPFHSHERTVVVLPNVESVKKVQGTFGGKPGWTFPFACTRWVFLGNNDAERAWVLMTNARFVLFCLKQRRTTSIYIDQITNILYNHDSENLNPYLLSYGFLTLNGQVLLNIDPSEPEGKLIPGMASIFAPGVASFGRKIAKTLGEGKLNRPGRVQNRALIYLGDILAQYI